MIIHQIIDELTSRKNRFIDEPGYSREFALGYQLGLAEAKEIVRYCALNEYIGIAPLAGVSRVVLPGEYARASVCRNLEAGQF